MHLNVATMHLRQWHVVVAGGSIVYVPQISCMCHNCYAPQITVAHNS